MAEQLSLVLGQLAEITAHALAESPREACGLVVVRKGRARYVPCKNRATTPRDQFALDPDDYTRAEAAGEVVAVVHSHPTGSAMASPADRVGCESSGLPWFILNPHSGQHHYLTPSGYVAPLIGRPFCFGVLDCYALIRDWYAQDRQIALPDFPRRDGFWLRGENIYLDGFPQAGFVAIPLAEAQHGDVVLMQIASPLPNHGGILLGDGTLLHHTPGRLSSRDVYGGYWRKVTTHCLRYRGVAA